MACSASFLHWNDALFAIKHSAPPNGWWVMGLMSGTSLDGVDVCLAHIAFTADKLTLQVKQVQHQHHPYPEALKHTLLALQQAEATLSLAAYAELHYSLGERYAEAALKLLQASGLKPGEVFVIGCHGQTLYHQPPTVWQEEQGSQEVEKAQAGDKAQKRKKGRTLQLGEASFIAQATGVATVSDFRPADMSVGGEGAPLVPFADYLLFADGQLGRCIQNLGGIGNVTALPPLQQRQAQMPIAFDTGPANMLLDELCRRFFQTPYDEGGQLAASGRVHARLLAYLQAHPYFAQRPPKSTGRELFGAHFLEAALLQVEAWGEVLSPHDLLATFSDFTAWSVAHAYEHYVWPQQPIDEVILGGGGAYNPTLVARLAFYLQQSARKLGQPAPKLSTHQEALNLPNSAKEALAFALLAWAHRLKLPNNLPSCTGASQQVVMGKLSLP